MTTRTASRSLSTPTRWRMTGFTGGGGPASVIYGDGEDDKADETAEEMLKAPDESD